MQHDAVNSRASQPFISPAARGGVSFDPELVLLEGSYLDEISAFRARRGWMEALEGSFLLDNNHDFKLQVSYHQPVFRLTCEFLTACGRYAFWRLVNNQSPEAQYVIETAHIPDSPRCSEELAAAPDLLMSEREGPLVSELQVGTQFTPSVLSRLSYLLSRLLK